MALGSVLFFNEGNVTRMFLLALMNRNFASFHLDYDVGTTFIKWLWAIQQKNMFTTLYSHEP